MPVEVRAIQLRGTYPALEKCLARMDRHLRIEEATGLVKWPSDLVLTRTPNGRYHHVMRRISVERVNKALCFG